MSVGLIEHDRQGKRRNHSLQLKALSDEAAEIMRLHETKKIDADEAARRLNELKERHRSFLDRLVG